MATSYRSTERFSSTGSAEALNMLARDKMESLAADKSVFQDQEPVSGRSLCHNAYSSIYSGFPSEPFLSGGYENAADNPRSHQSHAGPLGFENISHGIYDERSYYGDGFSPPDFHGPYASTTTQPSLQPYGELYADDSRNFLAVDQSQYQFSIPENVHVAPQVQVSRTNLPVHPVRHADERNFGVTENMMCSLGSSGLRNKIFGGPGDLVFMPNRFEEFRVSSPQSSRSNPFSRENSFLPLASTGASMMHMGLSELFASDFEMGSGHGGSSNGIDYASSFSYREYSRGQCNRGSFCACSSGSRQGNDYSWPTLDEARQGRCYNDFLCGCSATVDMLTERNRGPRACKLKGKSNTIAHSPVDRFSQQDFPTEYRDAKFFVIKSYSEDNVHKSIKYGVWASTANGNKKLDTAYREAKEKEGTCPVFLLFSVNASAQFCGVAEMVGPVDFNTSVEYWQQDKWTGHFPVKWLIIKDVPNSLFRHIILEHNDNKPVTNSRDTQEVGLEQGLEMLSIFKNYELHSSILDDFCFYEERQKAMQERKARQRAVLEASPISPTAVPVQPTSSLPGDLVKKLSKSFADALALDQNLK